MYDEVRIVYGPTGGRFAFLSGVIDALEERLQAKGIRILDRIGVSGGALSAAIRGSGESFTSWLKPTAQLRKEVELGKGFKAGLRNFTNLFLKGGMMDSNKVLDNMFRIASPRPPYDTPCYAVTWCSTLKRGVALNIAEDLDPGLCLIASCAMPVAFSPIRIHSSLLSKRIQKDLGILGKPQTLTFRDGGLVKAFPSTLAPGNQSAPVIVVDLESEPPDNGSLFTKACFKVLKSKSLEGIEEAQKDRPITVISIPTTPELNRFATRFGLTEEEGLWQYIEGLKAGRKAVDQHFPISKPFPFIPIQSTVLSVGAKKLEAEQSEETEENTPES